MQYESKSSSAPPPMATGFPVQQSRPEGPWSSGLFGCMDDVGTCCLTCCCPCITFGRTAEIVDKGATSCVVAGAIYFLLMYIGCNCCFSCLYRSKLRSEYRLSESPCNDFLVHCCCEYCALCQEYGELKSRGFDMSAGWNGNMANSQSHGSEMVPPAAPVMK
ncbi:hypothetical protein ACFE04_021679 [Oxalis oulophora]